MQYDNQKNVTCTTLLITRQEENNKIYGNLADDMVERYAYDLVYKNDMPLEKVEKDFMMFFEKNVLK